MSGKDIRAQIVAELGLAEPLPYGIGRMIAQLVAIEEDILGARAALMGVNREVDAQHYRNRIDKLYDRQFKIIKLIGLDKVKSVKKSINDYFDKEKTIKPNGTKRTKEPKAQTGTE